MIYGRVADNEDEISLQKKMPPEECIPAAFLRRSY
jgi:hypothetical protein